MKEYTVNVIIGTTLQVKVNAIDEDAAELAAQIEASNIINCGEETLSSLHVDVIEADVINVEPEYTLFDLKDICSDKNNKKSK